MAKNSSKRKPTWDEIYNDGGEVLLERRITIYRYHFISSFNWEDMTGEDNTAGKYHFALEEVDLPYIRLDTVRSAIEACGGAQELQDHENPEANHLYIAECLRSYGAYAPLEQWDGNNWEKLLGTAKKYSTELLNDVDKHQDRMNHPVNQVGNSAWDFMTGNAFNSRHHENLRTIPMLAKEYISVLEEKLEERDKMIAELTERLQERVA